MAQDDSVNIKFGAETSDAQSKIASLGSTIKDSMGQAGSSFSGFSALTVAAGTVIGNFAENVLVGLKDNIMEAVTAFADLGDSIEHMQHRLGGSAEELSALKVALEAVGLSTSTFESIARRLPMIMKQHQKDFKDAGVAYTDANGKLLPVQQTILNLNDHLSKFTAGAARNQEGMKLMGRTFFQMADMVELTSKVTKEATDVAQQFGLVLSEENVQATNDFGRETHLLKDALHGFYVEVGRALTPALTTLAEFIRNTLVPVFDLFSTTVGFFKDVLIALWDVVVALGDVFMSMFRIIGDEINAVFGAGGDGVTAMEFFHNVLNIIQIAIIAFKDTFLIVIAAIVYAIEVIIARLKQFSGMAISAFKLDWKGIQDNWNKGEADIEASVARMTKKIMDEAAKSRGEILTLAAGGSLHPTSRIKQTPGSGDGNSPTPPPVGAKASDNRLSTWRTELQKLEETDANFFSTDLKMEEKFWQDKLLLVKKNTKEDIKLRSEIGTVLFGIHKKQAQELLQSDLTSIKEQTSLFQKGASEKIRIAILTADRLKQAYGQESAQYKAQLQEINKLEVEHLNETIKLQNMHINRVKEHALNEIELEKGKLSTLSELGQITAVEELTALKALEEQKYQIELQAEKDRAALIIDDEEAQQASYDKLEQMAEQHAVTMQKVASDISKAQLAEVSKWLSPVTGAFETTVTGIIQGTTTMKKGFADMAQSIVLEFDKMCVQMLTKWLATQMQMQMSESMGGAVGGGFGGGFGGILAGLFGGGSGSGAAAYSGIAGDTTGMNMLSTAIPMFADGTNYVPRDTLAILHRGEAVVPQQYNNQNMGGLAVNNHFHLTGAMDLRTQQQIALQAGLSVQRAKIRNG